jgi:hypothetical protein
MLRISIAMVICLGSGRIAMARTLPIEQVGTVAEL